MYIHWYISNCIAHELVRSDAMIVFDENVFNRVPPNFSPCELFINLNDDYWFFFHLSIVEKIIRDVRVENFENLMRIFFTWHFFATLCNTFVRFCLQVLVLSSFLVLFLFSAALQLHLYERKCVSASYLVFVTLKLHLWTMPPSSCHFPWMCLYMRSESFDAHRTPISRRECDPRTEMRCDDGGCVLLRRKCDNIFDCLDGSDERGCGKGFISHIFLFLSSHTYTF